VTAKEVSAIIVTRGDVDLAPILATLPYGEVVIWDNSERERDAKTFGRFLAIAEAKNDVIYFQDDDVIFTEHEQLLAAYEPGQLTANMPSPWYEECSYDVFRCALVGAGSLVPRDLPWEAFQRYLAEWPEDDLFLDYCDFVHGILTSSRRFDFGYTILPHASAPNRIYTQPGAYERKMSVIERAIEIRDRAAVFA
jgi:hypothetical protein